MTSVAPRVLIVPGWTNSGPRHWQTLWERAHPEYVRVEQRYWDHPTRDEWCAALVAAVERDAEPAVLVTHSLGGVTVAHAAPLLAGRIRAALLVTPPDVERPGAAAEIVSFAPMPLVPLPFPSVVVASRNDETCRFERAREFATAWGSTLVDAGNAGHLNTDAGYGPWPVGEALLADLIASTAD